MDPEPEEDQTHTLEGSIKVTYKQNVASCRLSFIGTKIDGGVDQPVTVDCYIKEKLEANRVKKKLVSVYCPTRAEVLRYCNTVIALKREDPSMITIHHFFPRSMEVVVEPYHYCLLDLFRTKTWATFFERKPDQNLHYLPGGRRKCDIFNFCPDFQNTLRAIIRGIAVIQRHKFEFRSFSGTSIVFNGNDIKCRRPMLVDIFGEKRDKVTSNIWKTLGKVLQLLVDDSIAGIAAQPSEDIISFLALLEHPDVQRLDADKLMQHPSLLKRGAKLGRVAHVWQHRHLFVKYEQAFYLDVCENQDMTKVARKSDYMELMLDYVYYLEDRFTGVVNSYRGYDDTIQGCINLFRNTSVHLNHNAKNKKKKLTTDEIEDLMEELFPKLVSFLFSIYVKHEWLILQS